MTMEALGAEATLAAFLGTLFENERLQRELERVRSVQAKVLSAAKSSLGTKGLAEALLLSLYWTTPLDAEELLALRHEDFALMPDGAVMVTPGGHGRPVLLEGSLALFVRDWLQIQPGRSGAVLGSPKKPLALRALYALVANFPRESLLRAIGCHYPVRSRQDFEILPTPLRLGASPKYTGRGVTIAFLDSGFYPHPDLMNPSRRIVAFKDVGSLVPRKADFEKPTPNSWHGMQTCVSCAGNGYLSGGLYRGIACSAEVALIRVMGESHITDEAIIRGVEWAIRKKERYGIRILNISLGDDDQASFRESPLNAAVEEAVQAGIVVVVAAGNTGSDDYHPVGAPANAPSVITVGGLDDRNRLDRSEAGMYHSSYGPTADGFQKPEIIAPGIWVAAPILPGTRFFQQASLLGRSREIPSEALPDFLRRNAGKLPFEVDVADRPVEEIRRGIDAWLAQEKVVGSHYQHVDGTSFSAPIVCSVVAQMLEANPKLTPAHVKEILIQTAERMPGIPRQKQGFGVIQPRKAVERAEKGLPKTLTRITAWPVVRRSEVRFFFRDTSAKSVSVAGDFNGWSRDALPMRRGKKSYWACRFEVPGPGRYRYKFVVDGADWRPDPENPYEEADGMGGKNSVFEVTHHGEAEAILEKVHSLLAHARPGVPSAAARRQEALFELDRLLQTPFVTRCEALQEYWVGRLQSVLRRLGRSRPRRGIRIFQLYNDGLVIQTPELVIGIDVVSTRHVWGLRWPVPSKVIRKLADSLDVLLVSQRRPDHLDLDLVNPMIASGKTVVAPIEVTDVMPKGVVGFAASEERDFFGIGRRNSSFGLRAHQALHVNDRGRNLSCRMYEIVTATGLRLLHAGEHDYGRRSLYRSGFEPDGPVDVLIARLGGLGRERDDFEALADLLNTVTPGLYLPSHLAEIGHELQGSRYGYRLAYEYLERVPTLCSVLSWGESIDYPVRDEA